MLVIRKRQQTLTPRELFIRKAKKSKAGKDALKHLNDYLNAATPEPMYWLHSLWGNQQNAITYKELREAIKNGYMDEATLQAWQQDYAKVVSKRIFPGWYNAIAAGAQNVSADATNFGVLATAQWVADHGAELVTVISGEAREAIQALVGTTVNGQYTVDELSRAIRPLVGLTRPQAAANLRYYTKVRDALLEQNPTMKKATAEKRAQEAAMKYAARQHRYRAQMIAETETAKAYTQGYRGYVAQQVQNGALRPGVMVWDTAQDEAVCPVCGALNGQESDERFTFRLNGKTYDGPPAHPRCRCAEHFEERGEGAAPGGYTQAPWGASGVPGRPGVSPADPYSMTIQTKPEEIGGDGWREICRETHILRENGVDYEVTIVSENYNGTLAFRNRVDVKTVESSPLSNLAGSSMIGSENVGGVPPVIPLGKIDIEKYRCVTPDIVTDEVIITSERIRHIQERHPNDFERFAGYLVRIIREPDYILEANKPNTAFVLKEIEENGERFQAIVRLAVSSDAPGLKNSIITFLKTDEKRYARYLRTKKILYKSE